MIRKDNTPYDEENELDLFDKEIAQDIYSLKKGRPNEEVRHIFGTIGRELIKIYNECWKRDYFLRFVK